MGYIAADDILKAREMDLMTYLRNYEPQELVRVSGNTYCTREHESLRISNGKWYWFSHDVGGRSALDYLIKVKDYSFIDAVKTILGNATVKEPIPYYQKEKVNLDIGIEPADRTCLLVEEADVSPLFRPRPDFSHKGTYGYTALIGGSKRYAGAVKLAALANAAMRAGSGVVKLAVPDAVYHEVAPAVLEPTLFPLPDDGEEIAFDERKTAELISNIRTAAFGMGIGTGDGAARTLDYLLSNFTGRLVVDADGLNLLSRMDRRKVRDAACSLILTPHIKEFSRLSGLEMNEILSAPIAAAEAYAKETGAVLLLKGPATVVTDGETTYLTDAGCAGMATAGSGDVLSGVLAAVAAFAPDMLLGTAAAAYINGKAGELAQRRFGSVAMTSGDTAACVAEIVRDLERSALPPTPET